MLNAAQYAAINLLYRGGCTQREIRRLTGHDRHTIKKVVRLRTPPPIAPRLRSHKMDAFADYATQRLKAGRIDSVHLLASLRQRGFDGSLAAVQRFARKYRAELLNGRISVAVP